MKWLADHFAKREPLAHVGFGVEATVKQTGKRADGLVAVLSPDGAVHTVVLEAKSLRTLDALRERAGCGTMFAGTAVTSLASSVTLGWFATPRVGAPAGIVLSILGGMLVGLLFLWWADRNSLFASHGVLEQLRRYPAGEHWVAVPRDFAQRRPVLSTTLAERCAREDIGLVVVGRDHQIDLLVEPSRVRRHDELNAYIRGTSFREELAEASPGQPVPFSG